MLWPSMSTLSINVAAGPQIPGGKVGAIRNWGGDASLTGKAAFFGISGSKATVMCRRYNLCHF